MNNATITALVALVVVVIGGIAVAASQPGDTLYRFKASLGMDSSPESQAREALSEAQAVYDEASTLDSRGELDASTRATLSQQYRGHIDSALRYLAELEAGGQTEASAQLRTEIRSALREHDDIFPASVGDSASSVRSDEDSESTSSSDAEDDDAVSTSSPESDDDDDASVSSPTGGTASVSSY